MSFGRKKKEQETTLEHRDTRLIQYAEALAAVRTMSGERERIGAYLFGFFWMRTRIASFYSLLICADEGRWEKWEATTVGQGIVECIIQLLNDVRANTEEGEADIEKIKSMILLPFYRFFGETTFKPLGGDANAIVAEMETLFRDDGPIWNDSDWRDMVMAHLLKVFDGMFDRSETQEEVIDYLCKRWSVDTERYERLREKIYTQQETIAMADKLAEMLAKAGQGPFADSPGDAD